MTALSIAYAALFYVATAILVVGVPAKIRLYRRPPAPLRATRARLPPRRAFREPIGPAMACLCALTLPRRPAAGRLGAFEPTFTSLCVPSFQADPATEGTRTGTAILVHLERMEVIIVS